MPKVKTISGGRANVTPETLDLSANFTDEEIRMLGFDPTAFREAYRKYDDASEYTRGDRVYLRGSPVLRVRGSDQDGWDWHVSRAGAMADGSDTFPTKAEAYADARKYHPHAVDCTDNP